jgi:putative FmdB family regulatory protein
MPVYVYRCASCGHQFERHQFFQDEPLKICPSCRKKTLKKVITPTKVIFKGSGFYSTDNKSASGNNSFSASKSSDDKPEKKQESKPSESKNSETKSSEKSE